MAGPITGFVSVNFGITYRVPGAAFRVFCASNRNLMDGDSVIIYT